VPLEQVDAQCDGLGGAMEPFVAKLPQGDPRAVLSEVQSFALGTGMSADQLKDTGVICLFSGYRRDEMSVAIGSVLLMVAAGQAPYAELLGHHLSREFGVTGGQGSADAWYGLALSAIDNGTAPVFAPGQPERIELIRTALQGGVAPQPQKAALPTFNLGGN